MQLTERQSGPAVVREQPPAHSWLARWDDGAPPAAPAQGLRLGGDAGFAAGASAAVVFDGQLYNREELAASLGDEPGAAADDADVVLRAYRRWGEEALRRVQGVFALLVWDAAGETLLAVRDRLGVVPLFYANVGGGLVFSRSLAAVVRHPDVPGEVSRVALACLLAHHGAATEETFYTAVKRVPPGHVLKARRGGRELRRWWDPSPKSQADWVRADELGRFDELLEQAVGRCTGRGPAAVFLSGGFDSTSIAAVAADACRRQGRPAPLALSLGFPQPECNEEHVQRRVAAGLGLPQVLLPFDQAAGPAGLLAAALELAGGWPAPLVNPWRPAYQRLGRAGQERGREVILTGAGGDEWLTAGVGHMADLFRAGRPAAAYRLLAAVLRSYDLPRLEMLRSSLWTSGVRPLLAQGARAVLRPLAPGVLRARWRRRFRRTAPDWLAPDAALRRQLDERFEQDVERRMREPEPSGPFGFYLRGSPPNFVNPFRSMLREEDDEAGRRLGVRLRSPYWDAEVVHFLGRTPPELLLRGGREKGLVRESVARRFPDLGFERHRKASSVGFFRSILHAEGEPAWRKMGGVSALAALGVVEGKAMSAVLNRCLSDPDPHVANRLWELLSLEAWVRPRV
jgi:asparagine synthase (glutamine-hydrolysing)